jgi:hypothetical protein
MRTHEAGELGTTDRFFSRSTSVARPFTCFITLPVTIATVLWNSRNSRPCAMTAVRKSCNRHNRTTGHATTLVRAAASPHVHPASNAHGAVARVRCPQVCVRARAWVRQGLTEAVTRARIQKTRGKGKRVRRAVACTLYRARLRLSASASRFNVSLYKLCASGQRDACSSAWEAVSADGRR